MNLFAVCDLFKTTFDHDYQVAKLEIERALGPEEFAKLEQQQAMRRARQFGVAYREYPPRAVDLPPTEGDDETA